VFDNNNLEEKRMSKPHLRSDEFESSQNLHTISSHFDQS